MMNSHQANANVLMTMLNHYTNYVIAYETTGLNRLFIVTKFKEVIDLDNMDTDWFDAEESSLFQMYGWSAIHDNADAFVEVENIPGVDLNDAIQGFGAVEDANITLYRTNKTNLQKATRKEFRDFMNNYGA